MLFTKPPMSTARKTFSRLLLIGIFLAAALDLDLVLAFHDLHLEFLGRVRLPFVLAQDLEKRVSGLDLALELSHAVVATIRILLGRRLDLLDYGVFESGQLLLLRHASPPVGGKENPPWPPRFGGGG